MRQVRGLSQHTYVLENELHSRPLILARRPALLPWLSWSASSSHVTPDSSPVRPLRSASLCPRAPLVLRRSPEPLAASATASLTRRRLPQLPKAAPLARPAAPWPMQLTRRRVLEPSGRSAPCPTCCLLAVAAAPHVSLPRRRSTPQARAGGCLATRLDCGDGGACPLCWLSTHPPGRKPLALPAADNSAAVALSHGAARRR